MKMASATLMTHCGGQKKTREQLWGIETPEGTETWKPIPHGELVNRLIDGLRDNGIVVARDEYATMGRGDTKLFGVMELEMPSFNVTDYRMALGLRGSNDKSMAIQVIAAARVFVCDNMAFGGDSDAVMLSKKHTSGLDLGREVPLAVDRFLEKSDRFRHSIEDMKGLEIGDDRAKGLILDSFRRDSVLPIRLMSDVARLYFDDEEQRDKFPDRTLWSLDNAYTEAVKALKPTLQHRYGYKIGRSFGRATRAILGRPSVN
jgi:hypothetical protein